MVTQCDRYSPQGVVLKQRQVTRKNQPASGLRCRSHGSRNRIAHAGVVGIFKMPRQATGLHGIQRVLQHRLACQRRLQFVGLATRRSKTCTAPRS